MNIELFKRHNIFNEEELKAREDVAIDDYCKKLVIEIRTMISMVNLCGSLLIASDGWMWHTSFQPS